MYSTSWARKEGYNGLGLILVGFGWGWFDMLRSSFCSMSFTQRPGPLVWSTSLALALAESAQVAIIVIVAMVYATCVDRPERSFYFFLG